MSVKFLLFDLDGTLTDSCQGVYNGLRYAFKMLGEPVPQDLQRFMGPPLIQSFREFCGFQGGKADEAVRLFREYYAETGLFENTPYPGMTDTLQRLREMGLVLGVATCKTETYSIRIMEHFDMARYFDTITGAKPDRLEKHQVIEAAMKALGASADDTVMIGDRHHDAEGARLAGIPCVGALYGYGTREELEQAGCVEFVEKPEELLRVVRRN